MLRGLSHVAPRGLTSPARPSLVDEATRLRATYSKRELTRLVEMVKVDLEPRTIVQVVNRYYDGVLQTEA